MLINPEPIGREFTTNRTTGEFKFQVPTQYGTFNQLVQLKIKLATTQMIVKTPHQGNLT